MEGTYIADDLEFTGTKVVPAAFAIQLIEFSTPFVLR